MNHGTLRRLLFPLASFAIAPFAFFLAGGGLRDALEPRDRYARRLPLTAAEIAA